MTATLTRHAGNYYIDFQPSSKLCLVESENKKMPQKTISLSAIFAKNEYEVEEMEFLATSDAEIKEGLTAIWEEASKKIGAGELECIGFCLTTRTPSDRHITQVNVDLPVRERKLPVPPGAWMVDGNATNCMIDLTSMCCELLAERRKHFDTPRNLQEFLEMFDEIEKMRQDVIKSLKGAGEPAAAPAFPSRPFA